MREYPISLEMSLWSLDAQFPIDPLFFIERAFDGDIPPVLVRTAPREGDRFGSVRIARGRAEVSFYFQWKDPVDLVDDCFEAICFEPTRSERAYAIDRVSIWAIEATWEITRKVQAETFDELMEKIDEVESDLMELEGRQRNAFYPFFDEILQSIRDKRPKA
jgi:hypothetical protein